MGLVAVVGPSSFRASEIRYRRCLGHPVLCELHIPLGSAGRRSDEFRDLAGALEHAGIEARGELDGEQLGPAGIVSAVRWESETRERLIVTATLLGFHRTNPGAFVARRRVHRVSAMDALVSSFSEIVVPDDLITAELPGITFPDGSDTTIVQDGQSDWDFVTSCLSQCYSLRPAGAKWAPLTLVGSSAATGSTSGKWLVTSPSRSAFKDRNALDGRMLAFEANEENTTNRSFSSVGVCQSSVYPAGNAPSMIRGPLEREMNLGRWAAWAAESLPRFVESTEAMVWQIEDRIYAQGAREEAIGWRIFVHSTPAPARVAALPRSVPARSWIGTGIVTEHSAAGPWISVRLDGFESGADTARVRLTTPYAGAPGGQRGLHLVPEKDTKVVLEWAGRLGDSVALVGNARTAAAEMPSPSLWLHKTLSGRLKDARLNFDEDLDATLEGVTTVKSDRGMTLTGDGADVKLRGGIVRTGRE